MDNEGPQHEVTISHPFALGRFPVTFEEYDHFCRQTVHEQPDDKWGRDRRPVINVSWEDAQAYLSWLRKVTGQHYRLPSEAEWEYACRAGSKMPFSTGKTITTYDANYDGRYVYGSGKNEKGQYCNCTTEVGSYPANFIGFYDMHGNVWEWVEDCWNDNYEGAPTDGSAWLEGDCSRRVLRGGSWGDRPEFLRSASRSWDVPGIRISFNGFRVARAL